MSYKKTIDWQDEYVLAYNEKTDEEVEVAAIKFEYHYSSGFGLKLDKWTALDENENPVAIICDEESSNVEKYLDDWLHEELKYDCDYYGAEWEDAGADVMYEMYINDFGN